MVPPSRPSALLDRVARALVAEQMRVAGAKRRRRSREAARAAAADGGIRPLSGVPTRLSTD